MKLHEELKPYPQLNSSSSSYLLHRIDRQRHLLEETQAALGAFYRKQIDSSTEPHDFVFIGEENTEYALGSTIRMEPVWPLQIQIIGHPVIIKGPERKFSKIDQQFSDSLVWFPALLPEYPREDAILFGMKNWNSKDDAGLPTDSQCIQEWCKGKSREIRGQNDALRLVPGIHLTEWTVDCFLKFPLHGTSPDRILLGPWDEKFGAHVSQLLSQSKYLYIKTVVMCKKFPTNELR